VGVQAWQCDPAQLNSLSSHRLTRRKWQRQLMRATAEAATLEKAADASAFEEFSAGTARKYIMISGKGGVGKTSLAASLAVKLAAAGHQTLVVSTDPAHSLSDSLDQVTCRPCVSAWRQLQAALHDGATRGSHLQLKTC
jgi:DNA replication protein DnaC